MRQVLEKIILLFFAVLGVLPIIFLFTGLFMDRQEIYGCLQPILTGTSGYASWHLLPQYPTLQNLVQILLDAPEFFKMFWNSVKLTVCIMAGQLLFGLPAAWAVARFSFPGKKLVYHMYILLMMLPFQVMQLSEYLVLDRLHLLDTHLAVILPGIFSALPVFLMIRFFGGIPESVLEAARIDGAGEWQIFFRIGIPLGSSGILSAMVLSFLECWSMIEQPMTFLKTKSLWPLSLFLPEITKENAGFALCASFFIVLPAVCVFLSGQEYLEQGISSVAVKE